MSDNEEVEEFEEQEGKSCVS
ncbi:hypothetical protein R3I94_016915 [Phoxinus phoxinus]|uniref:Uncharacterized protein n=1 Tax=Phoxinus phoxinus TaxID=58324 RepID=A0AAN9CCY0_9TELE